MILTPEEGRQIVYGDHEDWEEVKGTRDIIDQSRWSTIKEAVFLHKPSGKYYRTNWSQGSTEEQEEQAFESDKEAEFTEVQKVTKSVEVWEEVSGSNP